MSQRERPSAFSMVSKVYSVPARLVFSLVLLGFPFLAGLNGASPWYVLVLAPVFAMADGLGKWGTMFRGQPLGKLASFLLKAVPVQLVVVAVVYFLGRGVGSLTGPAGLLDFGSFIDWTLWSKYAALMLALGLLLIWLERGKTGFEDAISGEVDRLMAQSGGAYDGAELSAPVEAITAETFFSGYHYSHKDPENRELLLPVAHVTAADIKAVEASLGIALPADLKQIYLQQNGGTVQNVYSGDLNAPSEDDLDPFGGYEDLVPLTHMRSLHDSICDYASEEQTEMFPKGARQMFILAQYYRQTLFLDYRAGAEPRVGYYDFDAAEDLQDDSWEGEATFFESFDSFFTTLYRQERWG